MELHHVDFIGLSCAINSKTSIRSLLHAASQIQRTKLVEII